MSLFFVDVKKNWVDVNKITAKPETMVQSDAYGLADA